MHQTLSKRNWTVNYAALCHARYHILDLKHHATVTLYDSPHWSGEYNPRPLHNLILNADQTAYDASYTLWHELGHALQCERDFNGDGDAFEESNTILYQGLFDSHHKPLYVLGDPNYDDWLEQYDNVPIEVEANEIAERYYRKYPLVFTS